ncbi:MAG TPA: Gfo/Idh/MocA family oxidoreductase [Candidatus Latescibacteria bacterium]|nr:Gfo/Idh/MocA family oxidoreductase [Candidatus Latescibacterota bacterium]
MVKVGIVGAGFMGQMHSNVYAALPEAMLVAVADIREENARKVARSHKALPYADFSKMLEKEEIDMVDICLPTYLHAEYAVKAAQAGKHVLCEKPMALTLEEADSMIEAAEKAGVYLMVAHCIRFWPEYLYLKRVVEEGELGELNSISLRRLSPPVTWSWEDWMGDFRKSGGAATDLHIHDTDFVLYLLGRPYSVFSEGTRTRHGWSHIFTIYHYETSPTAMAEGGWDTTPHFPFSMAYTAYFEKGVIDFNSARDLALTVYEEDKPPYSPSIDKPQAEEVEGIGNIAAIAGYFNEIQHFVNCIRDRKPPTVVTPEDARTSLEIILAEIKSAETGREVKL